VAIKGHALVSTSFAESEKYPRHGRYQRALCSIVLALAHGAATNCIILLCIVLKEYST
jgi:hypothetical protein